MRQFAVESFRSFLQTRGAFAGVGFSLLPAGAMALGLALRSNLSVELGLDETETAQLEFWANVISAAAMVLGGWLSDKLGRRRTLFVYLALMSLPTTWLAWRLQQLGYVMPRATEGGVLRDPALAAALWTATLVYNIFLGLMYGTRSAIMMDVTNPKVAATQFTAYMAMANLAIAYSATWQGVAVEAFFETALALRRNHGELYEILVSYFQQDPAAWDDARGLTLEPTRPRPPRHRGRTSRRRPRSRLSA